MSNLTLKSKIEKLIEVECDKIDALKRVIKSHELKIRYYKDMFKMVEKVEGDEDGKE